MNIKEIKQFAKHYNILITDDDSFILNQMKQLLQNLNFKNIYSAQNGKKAMEILQQIHIDIVLTDLKMPQMNGMELSTFIKTLNKDISVIVITGYTDKEDLINLIKIGVDGFIVKPIMFDNFIEAISKELIKLHNRDYVKTYSYLNIQKSQKEELKSVIIDILQMSDTPMFAKENNEIFFINNICFEKYHTDIDESKFVSKEIMNDIFVFKEKK